MNQVPPWPVETEAPKKYENNLSLFLLLLVIPLLVWKDAFTAASNLMESDFIQKDASKAQFLIWLTLGILILMNLIIWMKLKGKPEYGRSEVITLFFTIFGTYIIWSYLVTGMFMGNFRNEQPLYLLNLLLFWGLMGKSVSPFHENNARERFPEDRWALYFGVVILVILLLPVLSVVLYEGFPKANLRFPL